jgi:hypothetical protein
MNDKHWLLISTKIQCSLWPDVDEMFMLQVRMFFLSDVTGCSENINVPVIYLYEP